jgi:hypothetical protein
MVRIDQETLGLVGALEKLWRGVVDDVAHPVMPASGFLETQRGPAV